MRFGHHSRLLFVVPLCLLLASGGCGKRSPLALAIVIDMTGSTDAEGRAKAFKAVASWFEQKRLKRGDRVTVVPVTGDAWAESQGRVLRFQLSLERQAYDADLRRLKGEVLQYLEEMEGEAARHPYMRSDILGSVQIAAEDLAHTDTQTRKVLIVLSDFIQDDAQGNYKSSPEFVNEKSAQEYARQLGSSHPHLFQGCVAYLGLLRSSELKNLPPARRSALMAFWLEYFRQGEARSVISVLDGTSQVDTLLGEDD